MRRDSFEPEASGLVSRHFADLEKPLADTGWKVKVFVRELWKTDDAGALLRLAPALNRARIERMATEPNSSYLEIRDNGLEDGS